MVEIKKCLNEWNATVEALGQGKQTIIIRKYKTNLDDFLLFPTISYTLKDNFLESFKLEYQSFAKNYALPKKENSKIEIKYYAKIDKIFKKPSKNINTIDKFHIWTSHHVKSYLNYKTANIWLLRVYELEEPLMLSRTNGMCFANVNKYVSLENIKPVLSDIEFNNIKKELSNV